MKKLLIIGISICSMSVFAAKRGPWSLTMGPAWRARIKSSISGSATVGGIPVSSGKTSTDGAIEIVQDPDYPGEPDLTKYAATKIVSETVVAANPTTANLSDDGVDRPVGMKANLGYDFYSGETLSVGFNLKLAGYWNMRTSASGHAGGGTVTSRTTTEYYLYNDGPFPDDMDFAGFSPSATPYDPYSTSSDDSVINYPASTIRAKIRSDLYQIGLGPRVTWHALECLDIYGGVEALCNIAHMDFCVESRSSDETQCRLGFGGNIGAVAYLTDNLGVYAEAGYEWVDKARTDIDQAQVKMDYSSLVVSAGLVVQF